MKTTLTYATETCGRCGGSGHYSYNQINGTVCFGCHGQKTRLTKAGAKAQAAVRAFIATHYSVPVTSLAAGDRFTYEGRARTVATVETSGHGRYGVGTDANGETLWADYVSVTFTRPVRTAWGPLSSVGFCQNQTVVKAVSGADWDAVVAFARTLKSGVTVTVTA
jgi:hypothetical protein